MTFVEVNPRLGHLSKLNVTRLVKPWGLGLGTMLRVSGATLERRAAGLEEQHIQKKKGIIQRVIEKHSLYSLRPKRTLVNSFLRCKITKNNVNSMILDVFVQIYLVLRKLCVILHNESKQCRAGKGTSLFRFGRQYEELPVLTLTCLSHLFPCHDWQGYFFAHV